VNQARANRRTIQRPIVLAPVDPVPDARWSAPARIDPFTIPIEDKVALLLRCNAEALKVRGTRFVTSNMFFIKDERTFASTDGTFTVQNLVRSLPSMNVTAVAPDSSDFQSRSSAEIAPMGRGWEHVLEADLVAKAPSWPRKRCASYRRAPSSRAPTTWCSIPATCGSRSTSLSRTRRSSTAPWATRPTTPAPASWLRRAR
jgi:TldD protein